MARLTRAQVREVDRIAIEQYHLPGIVLMENAARAVADAACDMMGGECNGAILILCGGGNNGGDGLAVARHLHNRGANVTIGLCTDPERYTGDALVNWRVVSAMSLDVTDATPALITKSDPQLIIDAIFGTGLTSPPREPFPALADAINRRKIPVLAVDVPSGLDCDTGLPLGTCIRADRTVTFVAPKVGFAMPGAAAYTGTVMVGEIGCPVEILPMLTRP